MWLLSGLLPLDTDKKPTKVKRGPGLFHEQTMKSIEPPEVCLHLICGPISITSDLNALLAEKHVFIWSRDKKQKSVNGRHHRSIKQLPEWKSVFIWLNKCLVVITGSVLQWALPFPLFRIIELISWQTSAYSSFYMRSTTRRQTVWPLINGGKDRLESHYRGEII